MKVDLAFCKVEKKGFLQYRVFSFGWPSIDLLVDNIPEAFQTLFSFFIFYAFFLLPFFRPSHVLLLQG